MYRNVKGKQIFALSKQVSQVYLKSAFHTHIVAEQNNKKTINNHHRNIIEISNRIKNIKTDDKNTILFFHLFFCK